VKVPRHFHHALLGRCYTPQSVPPMGSDRERLLDVFDSLGYHVALYDRDWRCTYVNRAAARAMGRTPEAVLGRTLEALFPHAGDEPYTRQLRDAAAAGRPVRGDRFDVALERWFEDHVHVVPEGLLVLSRDVTLERDRDRRSRADVAARAEAEDALRHSRDVLSLAMRGGAMGAWSRDLATGAVWWSPELEHIVGLEPGAFSRTEDAFLELVHDDDKDIVRNAVSQAIETGTDYLVDFRFRHASGEWRWMEGRGRAVYGEDERPRSVYGIGIDVTRRKRTEAALEAARDAAESANRLKDQFLANLSHELRTPLNAILGYARLMQTDVIPPEKWRQAVSVIERNAVAQNKLVEDLLDMSRITTGTVHLDPAPIQIAPVIRQALDAVGPAAEAKRIEIALDLDPFAGSVNADTTRLQQVFWNLLNNAVKFTRLGGRVAVRLARTDRTVEVAITDTGIGIAPEFLPHVFTPFRQADSRFGRQYGGLGLGLAICRQLVELQGGTIEAASPGTGEGATFTVRFPACDAPETAAATDEGSSGAFVEPAGAAPVARGLAGVDVLLVDDEADTLMLFKTTLESHGARVRPAATAAEALAIADEWRPRLLVSDLGLPGIDGYELLRAIRAKTAHRTLAAVAVTAYARADDRARARAAGFDAYVSKPVDPAELVRTLVAVLPGQTGDVDAIESGHERDSHADTL
jgi:PAS domain S-box-containing protein